MDTPLSIFAGDRLRADLFNPTGRRLLVTFRHRVHTDGVFDAPRPSQGYVEAGHAHLHIQTRLNDWYINDETTALERALAQATSGYGRRVALGFSMGGYGALRFSSVLDLRHVVLVTPQFSIHPQVVPFDKRFRNCAGEFDAALGDLATHGRRQVAGVILLDPFRPLDLRNARLVQRHFRRLSVARTPGAGHQAARVLKSGGHFGRFQQALLDPPVRTRDVIAWHKAGRRGSAEYWTGLGDAAQKHGHVALADTARARAASLIGSKGPSGG
ncbi:alpha/beta hydrolase [uncultured Tateyamaria sp.]|uniref:alpha/beta hydrolase n=1 Tax=uncultured Tateyamaria sp. TaxID=455651 RepID=UPI0026246823|nr:alpha/beta hydrolase [uncultured Tateyamaria sp.]